MSFSQLKKVPSRILNRMSSWGGRNDDVNSTAPAGNVGEKDGDYCSNVVASGSVDGGGGGVGSWRKQRQRDRNCSESSSNRDQGGTFPLGVP